MKNVFGESCISKRQIQRKVENITKHMKYCIDKKKLLPEMNDMIDCIIEEKVPKPLLFCLKDQKRGLKRRFSMSAAFREPSSTRCSLIMEEMGEEISADFEPDNIYHSDADSIADSSDESDPGFEETFDSLHGSLFR